MNAQEERNFEAKSEQHFKGHRDTPCGRNFMHWDHVNTPEATKKYAENFDATFPNSPGFGM
jgi:hypothetical protein